MKLPRQLEAELNNWRQLKQRKPLILRGARQVGKSYLVESFAQKYFTTTVTINFELEPQYKDCFNSLKPQEICHAIEIMKQQSLVVEQSLLFLDEIQDCPNAIRALRYFKELMPQLHVIAAGSLLELALCMADYRMPVGRVSFLYLYPISFKEFLNASNPKALNYIETATLKNPIPQAIHQYLLQQLKLYLFLGGMPEAVANYQATQQFSTVQAIQASIIETYQSDFIHLTGLAKPQYLKICFNRIPLMIGQQIKYNKIDPDIGSRELKKALAALESASILQRIYASSVKGLPLDATINAKKFKLNFVDIGLVKRFNQLDASLLLDKDTLLLNQGALVEQFVGQELLAYSLPYEKPKLYFWARDRAGSAEVDYLTVIDNTIYPIEVKAGKIGKMRSLKQYLLEHPKSFGIRLSTLALGYQDQILSIPLYMLSELPRLVQTQIPQQ